MRPARTGLRGRVLFDMSTLGRDSGRSHGVVRTLRELGSWASRNKPDLNFVIYDSERNALRGVRQEWIAPILRGLAKIDAPPPRDRGARKQNLYGQAPRWVKKAVLWLRQPHRKAYVLLERWRLAAMSDAGDRLALWFQNFLLTDRFRAELTNIAGERLTLIPFALAVTEPYDIGPDDTLILPGTDWDLSQLAQLNTTRSDGPRIAWLCYDIIPLLFPEFCPALTVAAFRNFFHRMSVRADLVIFTGERVRSDALAYCAQHGLAMPETGVIPLGADFEHIKPQEQSRKSNKLGHGLDTGRYALFVSTIEPRKGHGLLFSVWKRLLAEGIAQAHGFKLVFVGRNGWLVDDLLADFDADPSVGDTLLVLSNVDDDELATLYDQSAFCVYPSIYEGYGLPIIESFRHGKAVIASTGGALPEVVGDFSPCLDPCDEEAWFRTLRTWIEQPTARKRYEDKIHADFRLPSWEEAARRFFGLIDARLRS